MAAEGSSFGSRCQRVQGRFDSLRLMHADDRGTLVLSCREVMDPSDREHFKRVGTIDTKLVELGYLPLFNN
nr:Imm52 family immunity protein [Stutzerimonas nitrititolerans]